MRIGQSAYRYGLPGYEIDDLLMGIANALGLSARVIATPSMLDCTIDGPGGQRRLFIRLGEVSYNLHNRIHSTSRNTPSRKSRRLSKWRRTGVPT